MTSKRRWRVPALLAAVLLWPAVVRAQAPSLTVSTGSVSVTEGVLRVAFGLRNTGGTAAEDVTITQVDVPSPVELATASEIPQSVGTIPTGSTTFVPLRFEMPGVPVGTQVKLMVKGSFHDATGRVFYFGGTRYVAVPGETTAAAVDAACQEAYQKFKTATGAGNVAQALSYVAISGQRNLGPFVRNLTASQRARIDEFLPPIRLVAHDERYAIFEAVRVTAGVLEGYPVSFLREDDGLWRLVGF